MENLAALLVMIKAADTEYSRRYGLVLQALGMAVSLGLAAGVRIDPLEQGWPVVYIELPTGQVSWHIPEHEREWDKHSTEEKFQRIDAYAERYQGAPPPPAGAQSGVTRPVL